MKFTIAAGVLAQTLPAISQTASSSSKLLSPDENHDTDLSRFLASRLKKHPTSASHRTLAATARRARFQARIHSGNQLTNTPFTSFAIMQCDPLSDDADIGILSSCGPGSECVVDKEEGNSLGGVCVQRSRKLQKGTAGYPCDLCGTGFTLSSEHYYDVLDIPEAGYEGITCRGLKVAAYVSVTMDSYTCSVVAGAAQMAGCCEPMCDLCGWASSVSESDFDLPVFDPVTGYNSSTCGSLFFSSYYNVTIATSSFHGVAEAAKSAWYYYNSTLPTSGCPVVAQAAKFAGCCSALWCDLCGYGAEVVDGFFAGTTCGDLRLDRANKNIREDDCPAAIQLAATEGCCAPVTTYDFNVCGDAKLYGDLNFYFDATFHPDRAFNNYVSCGYVLSLLNETGCKQYSADLTRICCSITPHVIIPNPPLQESTTLEPGTPSPSSATSQSFTMWSTRTLVSLMGLVTVGTTSAGALMLN